MFKFLKSRFAYWAGIGCCSYQAVIALLVVLVVIAFFGGLAGPSLESVETGEITACGESEQKSIGDIAFAPAEGKLGHEQHLKAGLIGEHYEGPDSEPLTFAKRKDGSYGAGAFAPYNTDEEHWYFNTQWGGWDWGPTAIMNEDGTVLYGPEPIHTKEAEEVRAKVPNSKLIITLKESGKPGKSIVVSAQESGPALAVTNRDGINAGAPPEVYNYLGGSSPYTKNPSDDKSNISIGFAKDQNINLGPCN